MKSLFLLATILFSVSAFSESVDCSLNLGRYDLSMSTQRSLGKKFAITKDSNSRFRLSLQTQCQNNSCATYAAIVEREGSVFAGAQGQSGSLSYFIQASAEKNAIKNLASCL